MSPRVTAGVCAYRGELLYLLWRWEGHWREIARCYSRNGEWWSTLHPLILRELARSGSAPAEPDLDALTRDLTEYVDSRLCELKAEERARMLIQVHDVLAGRLADTDDWPANAMRPSVVPGVYH